MISPHFPTNFEPFAHRLKANGVTVLGIADAPYDSLSEGLREALTEYYRVDDMANYDQMYRAVAYFAHKYGRIDRIESHNEHWLEMDARLRTNFNAFGLKQEDMPAIKTKSEMKAVFRQLGIPVACGRVFTDDQDARQLSESLGFPVIVKPNTGVGASDTYKLTSTEDLEHFLAGRQNGVSYMMEAFVEGDIVSFDGLVDRDGQIVYCSSNEHSEPCLETVSEDKDMFYYVSREMDQTLRHLGERCVKSFRLRERFFHFEFFRVKSSGEWVALEINARPPGGLTMDMWHYANDSDLFEAYARLVVAKPISLPKKPAYYCAYMSRKHQYTYRHSEEAILAQFGQQIVSIQPIPEIFAQGMGNIGILARTPYLEDLQAILLFVRQKQ